MGNKLKTSEATPIISKDEDDGGVRLKKEIGLVEGVAIICGMVIGSGIFLTPKGVLQEARSVGLTLVLWVTTGLMSMIGALCYAELGTALPASGGDYEYIREAYGPLLAFLYLWDSLVVFVPACNAIQGLVFSKYVIQPFFQLGFDVPDVAVRLLAAVAIMLITLFNCISVKYTARLHNMFLVGKVIGLLTIIVVGCTYLFRGHDQNFTDPWTDSQTDPGSIAVALYSGLFAYGGYNQLNFMTEELKNPTRNLPLAIFISLPLVTVIYVLANVGYLAVLSKHEMVMSDAIGVAFGNKMLGNLAWVMPVFVAMSTFGCLSVHIMTSSRLLFVGARNRHFPPVLSLVSMRQRTPAPALVFLCFLSLMYLSTSNIFELIQYASFVESFFVFITISGLLWLRYKRPELNRPIRVPLIVPFVFLCLCGFLVIVPVYVRPLQVGMGILITLTGVPIYFGFIWWDRKRQLCDKVMHKVTEVVQKLFMGAYQDHED